MENTVLIILINVMFLGIGGVSAGLLIIKGIRNLNKRRKCTAKVYGKVINNIQKREQDGNDGDFRNYWYTLCEYKVGETKCVRETEYGTFEQKYEIGQIVEIYYNPKNCHESYIEGEPSPKVSGIIYIILGILAIIMACIFRNIFISNLY